MNALELTLDELKDEIFRNYHILYDYFGENSIYLFVCYAKTKGIDTDYKYSNDLENLVVLYETINEFVDSQYRQKYES